MRQPLSTEAAVNALHVQTYRQNVWIAPRAKGTAAAPAVLANGLVEAQIAQLMANIPMPKYSGDPQEWDNFERTWNNHINN